MKRFTVYCLLVSFAFCASTLTGQETKSKNHTNADPVFNELAYILCRQIVDMSSIDKKDGNRGSYVKYSISDYLSTIPKDKREKLRDIVLKQIDIMEKSGIDLDPDEKPFVEKHPVDLSMLIIMSFNNQVLQDREIDQNIYDKATINILKETILQIKVLQKE
ncbi:MAG TPA: hypothetical protein DD381_07915 [Lentisphaeria bacterium]|nr:MAG: hypothetical protein A2X47_04480 [Lentisphaerae bacterium GWF2_38_69]HBM16247.1 hypothetical protein [Lentisphaeria bacterium]